MTNGMAMVMLSRATRAQDVHIVGEFKKEAIKCDTKYALPEAERLLKAFENKEMEERTRQEKCIKVSYMNVKSIKSWDGHRKDVV